VDAKQLAMVDVVNFVIQAEGEERLKV